MIKVTGKQALELKKKHPCRVVLQSNPNPINSGGTGLSIKTAEALDKQGFISYVFCNIDGTE